MKPLLAEMENKDRQHKMVSMIKKIIELHKPEQVEEIVVNIDADTHNNEDFFYIQLNYISPICEPLFHTFADKKIIEDVLDDVTYKWNSSIKRTLESFLNVNVVIHSELNYKKD